MRTAPHSKASPARFPLSRSLGRNGSTIRSPWEQEVQSGIRDLRPPVGHDQSLLVGEDAEGIAAVCLLADQGQASAFKIQAIAVAARYRGQGGAHADEALDVAFEAAAQRGLDNGRNEITMVS